MAMILLKPGSRLLEDVVSGHLNSEVLEPTKVSISDFDDCSYEVAIDDGSTKLSVKTTLPCFAEAKDVGASAALAEAFGASYDPDSTECDIDLSIELDGRADMDEKAKAELFQKVSLVKNIAMGGVFEHFFQAMLQGKSEKPFRFNVRADTTIFFCPGKEQVTVIFAIAFQDKVDKVLAKVFMQEFQDVKVARAPPCRFNVNPPSELDRDFGIKENEGVVGYLSFAVQKSNIEKPEVRQKTIHSLETFRTYLQYHIKCSKSFFHSRMRKRAKELLLVLNRAKIKKDESKKTKKTVSGRTFTRGKGAGK